MHVTGRCHCGHVTYEAELDPKRVSICHCTDCQTLSGSPFRVTAVVPESDLKLTGHEPKLYRKVAESGRVRQQYFCPECGSPLFVNGVGEAARIWGIRWGSIDQRAELKPQRQIWCRSAVSWLPEMADLPTVQTD
ncbi:GFA family protein [Neorhizobium galegae]|uniref:GFA family protein n=1 Tax=Neorhizobium galegae TaxID=399 RepID=UPI000620EA24|nr:GFA family protein [Neorhizobium galegae]CDZ28562.1 Glutathione-dependent formaldehyde-activating GFA [Neorhizobium galegae bv. officinalis]KAA9386058.1 GFA family protein [Neorhizobium galegae]KAB1113500.1 GFA family protein [Neorhizobium galegae]MCM2496462.1 GFA family protein [Neorhizobium galegae]MCQ1770402.1 GFA family protein [Neorhizobium galegae]